VGALDFLMLLLLAAAFGGAFGYVWACQDMIGRRRPSSEQAL
jgi:hypothetical protein